MFGTFIIELVVGLCFLFAVLGIVTSAITEAVLSMLKVRANHLQEWLVQWGHQMQGGADRDQVPSFALQPLLDHPIVAAQDRKGGRPSYLAPGAMAAAMLQSLAFPFGKSCLEQSLKDAEQALRLHIDSLNGRNLKAALHTLLDQAATQSADGTQLVAALQQETAEWLESSMGRIEGWTKRHAKKFSLAAAAVICLGFNVDALQVMRVLSSDAALRTELAGKAVNYVDQQCERQSQELRAAATTASGVAASVAAGRSSDDLARQVACLTERSQAAVGELGHLSRLGIGWDRPPAFTRASDGLSFSLHLLAWLVGIAVSTFAASLGGDFWFKWIGDIVRLTGYKPAARKDGAATPPADPSTELRWMQRLGRRH